MKRAAILLAIVAALVIAGCIHRTAGASSPYVQEYKDSLRWNAPELPEECRSGKCWCFVCKNGTNVFGPMKSLVGGYCYFEKNCNGTAVDFLENASSGSLDLRRMMVGQGPSFADFANAQPYCAYGMNLAAQWLVGDNSTPYSLPSAQTAMCYLSKDVLPMYILYSNGTNINISRTRDIARVLGTEGKNYWMGRLSSGPVGPVIVVTEIDYNISKANLVADQVRAINDECNSQSSNNRTNGTYCMVAVAPKIGDYAALEAVLSQVGDEVDFVAFGVNSHYLDSCDAGKMNDQILAFSTYALYNWSKPSIIPYIMFEPDTPDKSNTCTWTEDRVLDGYRFFFPDGIMELSKRGVSGIAAYTFNGTSSPASNPLRCKNCDSASSQARLQAWYAGCQAYVNVSGKAQHKSPGTAILFSNESGGSCGIQNENADFLTSFSYGSVGDRSILDPQPPKLADPLPVLYRCDECLFMNTSVATVYDFGPRITGTPSDTECNSFPEITRWAGTRNLDPMLVRAFIGRESNFDQCAVARVCKENYDDAMCFGHYPSDRTRSLLKDECYDIGYDQMSDPDGVCTGSKFNPDSGSSPDWRYCGLGMAQVIEPPWTFWPSTHHPDGINGQYYDVYSRAGLSRQASLGAARACNDKFNPFNVGDAMCLGTWKMETNMKRAKNWVRSNAAAFNLTFSEIDGGSDRARLLEAYISAHMYAGDWDSAVSASLLSAKPLCIMTVYDPSYTNPVTGSHERAVTNGECWTDSFRESRRYGTAYCQSDAGREDSDRCSNGAPIQRPAEGICWGYTDFPKFVRQCRAGYLPIGYDRAAEKMRYFLWYTMNCSSSFCPDGKKLLALGPPFPSMPRSGTPYLPDN